MGPSRCLTTAVNDHSFANKDLIRRCGLQNRSLCTSGTGKRGIAAGGDSLVLDKSLKLFSVLKNYQMSRNFKDAFREH